MHDEMEESLTYEPVSFIEQESLEACRDVAASKSENVSSVSGDEEEQCVYLNQRKYSMDYLFHTMKKMTFEKRNFHSSEKSPARSPCHTPGTPSTIPEGGPARSPARSSSPSPTGSPSRRLSPAGSQTPVKSAVKSSPTSSGPTPAGNPRNRQRKIGIQTSALPPFFAPSPSSSFTKVAPSPSSSFAKVALSPSSSFKAFDQCHDTRYQNDVFQNSNSMSENDPVRGETTQPSSQSRCDNRNDMPPPAFNLNPRTSRLQSLPATFNEQLFGGLKNEQRQRKISLEVCINKLTENYRKTSLNFVRIESVL